MTARTPYLEVQRFTKTSPISPLAAGYIWTYESGTTTPKDTYADYDGGTLLPNPVVLDQNGSAEIYLGPGVYTFDIYSAEDVHQDTFNNIIGAGNSSSAVAVLTIADLRNLAPDASPEVIVGYHTVIEDQGGGIFIWDATSSAIDDNGTTIVPFSTPSVGRWIRQTTAAWDPRWFGAIGDNATNDSFAIVQAINSAAAKSKDLSFSGGTYKVESGFTIPAGMNLTMADDAIITSTGAVTIIINDDISANADLHFSGLVTLTLTSTSAKIVAAEWFSTMAFALTAIGSTVKTLTTQSAITLTANATFPATMTWVANRGTLIDGAYTLAVNSTVRIGNYQVLGSSVTSTFGTAAAPEGMQLVWFPNIAKAITAASSLKKSIVISDVYTLTGAVNFPANVRVIFDNSGSLTGAYAVNFAGGLEAPNTQIFASNVVATISNGTVDFVIPQWWGAVADGVTTSTDQIQLAANAAQAAEADLYFPPTDQSYKCGIIFIEDGNIKIFGDNTKMLQIYDAEEGSGGPGSTKVTPIFFCTKTSANIEITGFDFYTDDSTFGSFPGWESYLSVICVNRASNVKIHHNNFNGGQDRSIFVYGGNYVEVADNYFNNNSMIMHIGIVENENFWDLTNDDTTAYSPIAPIIRDNYFVGYNKANNLLFLSGANYFQVTGNKFININNAACTVMRLYVNDRGPSDINGVSQDTMTGVCKDNVIRGTFLRAMFLSGYANFVPYNQIVYKYAVEVRDNDIAGTGVGAWCEKVPSMEFTGNRIVTTSNPVFFTRELLDMQMNDNHFECTVESVQIGESATIIFDSNVTLLRAQFCDNTIVTPEDNKYSFFANTPVVMNSMKINGNKFFHNSTVADNRVCQFSINSNSEFSNNEFTIESLADIFPVAINKTIFGWTASQGKNYGAIVIPTAPNGYQYMSLDSGADTGTVEPTWPTTIGDTVVDNEVTWICQRLFSQLTCNSNRLLYTAENVRAFDILVTGVVFGGNTGFQQVSIAGTQNAVVCNNVVELAVGSTQSPMVIEDCASVSVYGNTVTIPFALNSPAINVDSCTLSNVSNNVIVVNSTIGALRASTSGSLSCWGNLITNSGAGPDIDASGSATVASMTENITGPNVASANDITLGAGNSFAITGTTTINRIMGTGLLDGAIINLIFESTCLVANNVAAGSGYLPILLMGRSTSNFRGNETLTLIKTATAFIQTARGMTLKTIETKSTPVNSAGGGDSNLMSLTIPGGLASINGDTFKVVGAGTFAANANTKAVYVNIGGVLAGAFTAGAYQTDWSINLDCMYVSATSVKISGVFSTGTVTYGDFQNANIDLASNRTVQFIANDTTAADTVQEKARLTFEPGQ